MAIYGIDEDHSCTLAKKKNERAEGYEEEKSIINFMASPRVRRIIKKYRNGTE